ncbi:hypothetical protein Dsin_018154 [Dipteronia sinensis]|uniref:RING-type E3 ubiquitin transferase n=1 Tax=Dipteronia sinensis TaxID=43782 RepID=A0AAE0AHB3_9ROSI|nr:hypothetical protein Dsin_018154 [Dipteronia sinensis]
MREFPISSYLEPPPPPPLPLSTHPPKSSLPMLYYGLVVVGTAAIVLAIYNLVIIKWCTRRESRSDQRQRPSRLMEVTASTMPSQSFENPNRNLLSSFKYKKGSDLGVKEQEDSDYECAVCLSVFEEGEEVKQLPRCKHSFHAPCIDMWLYSHSDCPLCRAAVDDPRRHRHAADARTTTEHSREGLLMSSGISV